MEATSYVLSCGTYFMPHNPRVKAKLEAELAEAQPYIRNFDHRKIMALPYPQYGARVPAPPSSKDDEEIFPSPNEFLPERWMGSDSQDLEKWNVAFRIWRNGMWHSAKDVASASQRSESLCLRRILRKTWRLLTSLRQSSRAWSR
ncbi:unnamed protein product [Penicillium nalgiovense]|nr:unnamed protein product [Penicillium nalgiovense]